MKDKILVCLHVPPPCHGSAVIGKYIVDLLSECDLYDSDFVDLGTSRETVEVGRYSLAKFTRVLRLLSVVVKQTFRNEYSAVYFAPGVNGFGWIKDSLLLAAIRLLNKGKIIFHFHNKGVRENGRKWIYRTSYRLLFKDAFAIVLSEGQKDDITEYFDLNKIFVLPNPIDDNIIVSDIQQKDSRTLHLLYLSNLVIGKGLFESINVLHDIVNNHGIRAFLRIVGREVNISFEELSAVIRAKGLEDIVEIVGPRYGEFKTEEFGRADILLFPSTIDTFGLVVGEAMLHKLPVVAFNVAGVNSLVVHNQTGKLVEPGCNECLVGSVLELHKDRESLRIFGEAGRRRILKMFTLEKFHERFLGIVNLVHRL